MMMNFSNMEVAPSVDDRITSWRVGGKFSGPCAGMREEALNFLDFFASFLGQAKNEEPVRLEDNEIPNITVRIRQEESRFKMAI